MFEILKGATGSNKDFLALLTNLLKAFYRLFHDLLIAKLHVYDLDIDSLNIIQDYFSDYEQSTKVDSVYSSWEAIPSGNLRTLYLDNFCSKYLSVTCF